MLQLLFRTRHHWHGIQAWLRCHHSEPHPIHHEINRHNRCEPFPVLQLWCHVNIYRQLYQHLGTKVGVGVGILLGVFVLGFLSWLFYREFAKTRRNAAIGGSGTGVISMPSLSPSSPSASSPLVQSNTASTTGYAFGGGYTDRPNSPRTESIAAQHSRSQEPPYSTQPSKQPTQSVQSFKNHL